MSGENDYVEEPLLLLPEVWKSDIPNEKLRVILNTHAEVINGIINRVNSGVRRSIENLPGLDRQAKVDLEKHFQEIDKDTRAEAEAILRKVQDD